MTVTRELYPLGFYLVIVAKTDNFICHTPFKFTVGDPLEDVYPVIFDRVKNLELNIDRQITETEYVVAVFGALAMFLGFYFAVFLISCVLCIKDYRMGSLDEDQRPIISTIEVSGQSMIFLNYFFSPGNLAF